MFLKGIFIMKKNIFIIISLVLNIGAALGILYVFNQKRGTCVGGAQKSGKTFNVALFAPASHPAMDEINQGFMDTLQGKNSSANYVFKTYNANGNKTLLRAQAEEMVAGNFDLIFTIGASCSKTVKELTTKRERPTPLVFTAVGDPIGLGIVSSFESSGNNATGISEYQSYAEPVNLVMHLKPTTKKALLVFDPMQGKGDVTKQELSKLFSARGVELSFAEVFNPNEIQSKVGGVIAGVDVIVIQNGDHTVVSGVDALVNLCNRYGITLLATDLNSGDKGAALAYGVTEYDFGTEAAKKALQILEQHKKPAEIPTTPITKYTLKINSKTMEAQGLKIEPTELALLRVVKVI